MRIHASDIAYLLQLVITCSIIHNTVSTCNKQQANSCRKAAEDGKLDKFSAGGSCVTKQYVSFTHACTVNTYLGPKTDFCCCVHDRNVMCCRYQQAGELFRCTQSEDTIDELPPEAPPLEILLPVILGPLAVIACCVFCIIKCCCYNYDSDDNEYCDIPCFKKRKGQPQTSSSEKSSYPNSTTRMSSCEEARPLNRNASLASTAEAGAIGQYSAAGRRYSAEGGNGLSALGHHPASTTTQFSTDSTTSETKLLRLDSIDESCMYTGGSRRLGGPSAPPVEELDEAEDYPESAFINFNGGGGGGHSHRGYDRLISEVSTTSGAAIIPPYEAHTHEGPQRSISMTTSGSSTAGHSGMGACPSCASGMPSCPPPTYADCHKDPVI